ncbi:hypothetical protein LVY72_17895 [Arthrobacter sp. I2-34]|uniref:Uncharacterized protein n=1 Tax=Arthrobacter hankyongi TaxID=2904801 RepID=A0ABS9LAS7_9MICC|nr:hypothetical protein [Arthrobacter hankyongi]MCG2623770.1 hypothetical protein [Arthrobacter hankyongi]
MIAPSRQQVSAGSRAEADQLLNAVVEELQLLARQDGTCGILVTKTGPGQFTVELSDDVPFGITEERIG